MMASPCAPSLVRALTRARAMMVCFVTTPLSSDQTECEYLFLDYPFVTRGALQRLTPEEMRRMRLSDLKTLFSTDDL